MKRENRKGGGNFAAPTSEPGTMLRLLGACAESARADTGRRRCGRLTITVPGKPWRQAVRLVRRRYNLTADEAATAIASACLHRAGNPPAKEGDGL